MLFAVIPAAPALVPALGGRAAELVASRTATAKVVAAVVDTGPRRIVVVGDAGGALDVDTSAGATLRPFGVDLAVGGPRRVLPGPHAVAAWWLDDNGWTGERRHVDPGTAPVLEADDAVIVVADGSARRSERAPGHLDPRAEDFDAMVTAALTAGDAAALSALDRELAADLMVGGVEPLRWLGGAVPGRVTADLVLAEAPLGVGYWCATWRTA